jgi:2,3-diketo-5-methylthio-1-phosphopentane phosphatase
MAERRLRVFCDFDGTISTRDVGVHILERVGAPGWREIARQYVRGEIGSRECLVDEWELVTGDEAELRAIAAEVPLDPGFERFVRELHDEGVRLTVVSDGFGFYVDDACRSYEVDVLTNAVDFTAGELLFPHEDRCCPCSSCGVCKQAPIRQAGSEGLTTVLVGDGVSDRKAALLADVVFAKGALARWCDAAGVAYHPFETLDDVTDALT